MSTKNVDRSRSNQVLGLAGWLVLVFLAAALGGFASANAGDFYQDLVRPPWAPPSWLFGPVWTVLYTMMGVSAWLVWRDGGWKRSPEGFALLMAQLIANALWTWLFFVWQLGGWAFAEIVLLWCLILGTLLVFRKHSRLAAALLVPYLLWVSFAAALTYATWSLNPTILG